MRAASFRDNASLNTGPKQFYRLLRAIKISSLPLEKKAPPTFERRGGRVGAHTCACNVSYYLLKPKVAMKMTGEEF